MARLYCAVATLVLSGALAEQPYDGFTGAASVNPLSDDCWTNVTLAAAGKRALVICTSHGEKMKNGKPTGIALEEAVVPYYVYADAGMKVDIASILGGVVPIGETTPTPWQLRYKLDRELKAKFQNSTKIDDVDFTKYDVVFMVGGWGAAFDLGYSQVLGKKVEDALEARKPLVGSTCHGALGFVLANKTDGTPWLKGMKVTGVTDAQIAKLGIKNETPMHPEETLRAMGADYQCVHGSGIMGDVGATSVAIDMQGPIVITGQNQNSACVVAQRQLLFLASEMPNANETFSWVPAEDCKSPLKVCYQGLEDDVLSASRKDLFNLCRYGGHAEVKAGSCASFGYARQISTPLGPIVKDPLFRRLRIFGQGGASPGALVV